uniref:Uncharacterized protein n=1 Tax=Oryza punctata TaxID=4537 RepID=A0A0E0MLR7_ORYPU
MWSQIVDGDGHQADEVEGGLAALRNGVQPSSDNIAILVDWHHCGSRRRGVMFSCGSYGDTHQGFGLITVTTLFSCCHQVFVLLGATGAGAGFNLTYDAKRTFGGSNDDNVYK